MVLRNKRSMVQDQLHARKYKVTWYPHLFLYHKRLKLNNLVQPSSFVKLKLYLEMFFYSLPRCSLLNILIYDDIGKINQKTKKTPMYLKKQTNRDDYLAVPPSF